MPSEQIKNRYAIVRYRMTDTEGTISYSFKYNGGGLWIREHVTVPPYIRRRLKGINSTLDFRWDKIYKRWNLVHEKLGSIPYIETTICNKDGSYRPIDERVFNQLKYDMWWSEHIKYHATKMDLEAGYERERIEKRHDGEIRDVAKELAPLVATIGDAHGSSHGNSKFMHHGIGEGKVDA